MPLELRQRRLAAQYCLKVSSDTSDPAVHYIFSKCFTAYFQRYLSQICCLGFHVSSDLCAICFAQKDILPVLTPWHPPLLYSKPVLDLSLNKYAKSDTSPEIFQSNLFTVCEELSDYHHIDTRIMVLMRQLSREEVKSLPTQADVHLQSLKKEEVVMFFAQMLQASNS